MNVLSLFSGIGGLELGLERAGMTVVGQVEIDPYCRRVLAKHWPEVPRHDDVRTAVAWWQSEPRPRVDLVCGGFPCQDISNAGKRSGITGERSGLWSAMAATVRALQPRYVLVENVPALLARGLDVVLADLAASGYDADWDCVPAAAVGAPHLRDRIFIVAHTDSLEHEGSSPEDGRPAAPHISADTQRDELRQQPVTIRRCGDPAVARDDGAAQPVADTDSERQLQPQGRICEVRRRPSHGRQEVADTDGDGLEEPRIFGPQWRPAAGGWWATEPDVGRVAHGVPARVDRLRALGNAVVPEVAEHIGRLILTADRQAVRA